MPNTTPTPTPLGADALIDELEYAILGVSVTGNLDRVRAAKAALRAALASAAQPPPPAVAQEPRAWRDYAEHLECCRTCAEDSVGSCHDGAQLKVKAMATPAAQRPVAWMDDGSTRNGSRGTDFRVVTDRTKRDMPRAASAAYVIPLYAAPAPAAQGDALQLDAVRQAIRDYHFALDSRRHGGVAADAALGVIESVLGMGWKQGAEAAARAAKEGVKP